MIGVLNRVRFAKSSHVSTSLPKYKFIIQSQMQVIPSGQIWERIHVLYKVPPGGSTGREGICQVLNSKFEHRFSFSGSDNNTFIN